MDARSRAGEVVAEKFRIVSELGRGGGAVTFEAETIETGQRVALKELDLRGLRDWKVLELFEREARALQHLAHPRIPRYVVHFRVDAPEGPIFYLAQELVEGANLATWVRGGGRFTEYDIKQIASDLLGVIDYLHSQSPPLIHRDIKPENIVRRGDGALFLVDFGGVRDTTRTASGGSTVVGTYGYMAPEQFRGVALPATDLYGLGATLLFLLTGRSPSELPHERLRLVVRHATRLGPGLSAWLQTMLEPAPEDRFQSAREALDALRAGRGKPPKGRSVRLGVLLGVLAFTAVSAMAVVSSEVRRSIPKGVVRGAAAAPAKRVEDLTVLPERPPDGHVSAGINPIKSFAAHASAVYDIVYAPDGKTLFTAGDDGTVKAWGTSDWEQIHAFAGHTARVGGLAVTSDGSTLLASASDGTWRSWDVATATPRLTIPAGEKRVTYLAVTPGDSAIVATCGYDGRVRLWSRTTGALLRELPHSPGVRLLSVAFSPDGKRLVSAGDDTLIKVWDVETGTLLRTLSGNTKAVDRALISPDGQTVASACDDGTLRSWRLTDGVLVRTTDLQASEAWTIAFSPPGDIAVAGTKFGRLVTWSPLTGEIGREASDYPILTTAFAPDGQTFATGHGAGVVRIWPAHPKDVPFVLPMPRAGAPASGQAMAEKGPREEIFNRAWSELDRYNLGAAEADIAKLDHDAPGWAATIVLKGRLARKDAYNRTGEETGLDASLKLMDEAIARDPNLAVAYAERTWDLVRKKKTQEAVASAATGRRLDPQSTAVHLAAAEVETETGDLDQAERDLLAVLDTTSDRRTIALAYSELSSVYWARRNWDGVEAVDRRITEIDPNSLWTYATLAEILDRRGKYDDAAKAVKLALAADPDYGRAREMLAKTLTHHGEELLWGGTDREGAKRLFEEAIAADPRFGEAYYGLGAYYRWFAVTRKEKGALEPSRQAFEKALQRNPKDGRAATALAEHPLVAAEVSK